MPYPHAHPGPNSTYTHPGRACCARCAALPPTHLGEIEPEARAVLPHLRLHPAPPAANSIACSTASPLALALLPLLCLLLLGRPGGQDLHLEDAPLVLDGAHLVHHRAQAGVLVQDDLHERCGTPRDRPPMLTHSRFWQAAASTCRF